MSAYTRLGLSESVWEGIRSPPQQAAGVVDPARADAGQVHVDRRLLDALPATPVAFRITADSKTAPFSFGTPGVIVPAFTVRFRS